MNTKPPRSSGSIQHLIFDADDTLWENNIHFERAIGISSISWLTRR
jgi:hypothetical protein